MQTFLPYEDFVQSARVLDAPRLGKQRVETLQILRALVLPSYGWQTHPVVDMWRGYVPALTRYGLDMVSVWAERGHADSTAPQMLEFAPEVGTMTQADLTDAGLVPSWLGNEELHLSHRSNLIRKAPELYAPHFPGEPDDLPYLWPGADPGVQPPPPPSDARPLWILRVRDEDELDRWRAEGVVSIPAVNPSGRVPPKWRRQLDEFAEAMRPGDRFAVLAGAGQTLPTGVLLGAPRSGTDEGGRPHLARAVSFDAAELARSAVPYPAVLQDPRMLFSISDVGGGDLDGE